MNTLKHQLARSGAEVSSAEILHDNLDDQEQVIVQCPGGFSGSIGLTCQKGMILTEGCLDSDSGGWTMLSKGQLLCWSLLYVLCWCNLMQFDAYSHHVIRCIALGTIGNWSLQLFGARRAGSHFFLKGPNPPAPRIPSPSPGSCHKGCDQTFTNISGLQIELPGDLEHEMQWKLECPEGKLSFALECFRIPCWTLAISMFIIFSLKRYSDIHIKL
jgi:hypothetical protein